MAVERLRRIMAKVVIALGAAAALIAGGTMIAYPAAAAVACPACYGFQNLGHNLFVEASMSPEQRTHTSAVVDQARDQVTNFYGGLSHSPRILVCATSDCYRQVGGGGSRGMGCSPLRCCCRNAASIRSLPPTSCRISSFTVGWDWSARSGTRSRNGSTRAWPWWSRMILAISPRRAGGIVASSRTPASCLRRDRHGRMAPQMTISTPRRRAA
jgi:hypothetical protein